MTRIELRLGGARAQGMAAWSIAVLLSGLVAGCGGSGGDDPAEVAPGGGASSGSPGGSAPMNEAEPSMPGASGAGGSMSTGSNGDMLQPTPVLSGAGVVVADASGANACVPLCVTNTDPAADPEGDAWSSENGASCVIPGTVIAANQACTLGQPLPSTLKLPGVVLVDQGLTRCAPLCRLTLTTAADTDAAPGDGWSYENNDSCVIPDTRTGRNQGCIKGDPLPAPLQLPGVVIVDATTGPVCRPICRFTLSTAADTDEFPMDGWSYEDNLPCVIPGTDTATANFSCSTGGALPNEQPRPGLFLPAVDGLASECRPTCSVVTTASSAVAPDWGYEFNSPCILPATDTAADRRACTYGGPAPVFTPPALDAARKVAAGFFTRGNRLLDAYGNDFVIRGVNNPHIYFDTAARYEAFRALDRIASLRANTIRVVWDTTGPASLLEEILHRIVELKMVPMLELHDVTSSQSADRLLDMAEYYARDDIRRVLVEFREYLLINVANEWSGADGIYVSAYRSAIQSLRNNGISHTLVLDANGFGQNGQIIVTNGRALVEADSQRNLLFSVHMYQRYGSAAAVDATLDGAVNAGVPIIVGEFGQEHDGPVAWERILARAAPNQLNVGYIAWSWFGNGTAQAQLDMAGDWDGALTGWGQSVMVSAAGSIQSTARPASIFQ